MKARLGGYVLAGVVAFTLGLSLGIMIQKPKVRVEYVEREKIVEVQYEETPESLLERCGFIPNNIGVLGDHFSVVIGPVWSPDCRYIAWSLWQSGTGYFDDSINGEQESTIVVRKKDPREGLYVYNDRTRKTQKVYDPKNLDEGIQFVKWVDADTIEFTANRSIWNYGLSTGLVPVESR